MRSMGWSSNGGHKRYVVMKVVPCYILRVEEKGKLFKEMWNEAKFGNDRWNQVKVNLQWYMHAQFLVARYFFQVKSEITVSMILS